MLFWWYHTDTRGQKKENALLVYSFAGKYTHYEWNKLFRSTEKKQCSYTVTHNNVNAL